MSIHPTITDAEVKYVCESIKSVVANYKEWQKDYNYEAVSNEFVYNKKDDTAKALISNGFDLD